MSGVIAGCADNPTAPLKSPIQGDTTLAAVLEAHGFSSLGARDLGRDILVERDIVISKALIERWRAAQERSPWSPSFQWSTNTLVDQSQVQYVLIDLSGLSSVPDWQTAARNALWYWNAINNSSVYLVEGSPGDITVTWELLDDNNTAARSQFPGDGATGKPGPTIKVNSGFDRTPNNASTKLNNMAHEIGHTLGFRHTNWQNNPCVNPLFNDHSEGQGTLGANQIPGTPQTDASSVMNGCNALGSWNGFSNYDRIAVATLYPGPANLGVSIYGDAPGGTIIDGHFTWGATASGGTTPYTYYWSRRNFCEQDFQPISTGETYEEDTYYGEEPFFLKVTAYSPFKGQSAETIEHVGGFWQCN